MFIHIHTYKYPAGAIVEATISKIAICATTPMVYLECHHLVFLLILSKLKKLLTKKLQLRFTLNYIPYKVSGFVPYSLLLYSANENISLNILHP